MRGLKKSLHMTDAINRTYEEIYKDVRLSVDLCHRDGVIKDEVARNPGKYIQKYALANPNYLR